MLNLHTNAGCEGLHFLQSTAFFGGVGGLWGGKILQYFNLEIILMPFLSNTL